MNPTAPASILVVDDEAHMRRVLEIMLGQLGHRVHVAADGRQALTLLESTPIDLVLTDLKMPVLDGIGLLEAMAKADLRVPAVVMTAYGTVETAVQAMKAGAQDYLLRPFDVDALELTVARVLSREQLRIEHDFLRDEADRASADFVGSSAAMREIFEQIARIGPSRAAVLITGETGTGKELAARALHRASERRTGMFVAVNCAALPSEMIEAELFGHEKGAFTGALKDRVGKFELANQGSIFLDEIAEMPIALQAKLLRVLQEGQVERLGSNRSVMLDLRVIAACNRDPREAIREGRLREDLYYRLAVFSLELPPLRRRRDDIPDLVRHLAARQGRRVTVAADALECLQAYDWPGNVRELDNVVQRALVLGGSAIATKDLPDDLRAAASRAPERAAGATLRDDEPTMAWPRTPGRDAAEASSLGIDPGVMNLAEAVARTEAAVIAEALRRTGDNKRRAAALLGISERSLWYKLCRGRY